MKEIRCQVIVSSKRAALSYHGEQRELERKAGQCISKVLEKRMDLITSPKGTFTIRVEWSPNEV